MASGSSEGALIQIDIGAMFVTGNPENIPFEEFCLAVLTFMRAKAWFRPFEPSPIIAGGLFVEAGDPPTILEPIEQSFDLVSLPVDRRIVLPPEGHARPQTRSANTA